MAVEGGSAAALARQYHFERVGKGPVLGDERQQQLRRHGRVAPEIIEPGGDHRLRLVAIDQRRAERRIRVRPADQHRSEAAAPAADARGEQARELATGGPHQYGTHVRAEHWRRGERKGRFVEHVGLERARGECAPFRGDGFERCNAAPLAAKCWTERSVHGSSAL